jgi:hypothetical protein
MSANVTGVAEVKQNLNKMLGDIVLVSDKALMAAGLRIMAAAQLKVPVDTGRLRTSAKADVLKKGSALTGGGVVSVKFNTEYAQKVHEDLHARHTVGEAKYLENAVIEETPGVIRDVKRIMGIK